MVGVEMGVRVAGAIVAMGRKGERGSLLETGWLGGNGADQGDQAVKGRKLKRVEERGFVGRCMA
jgi:hypothetical protein